MLLHLRKCRFGPLRKRYHAGEFKSVEKSREVAVDDSETKAAKRGVAAGLDRSHSRDYKVDYVSDPVVIASTSDADVSHQELKEQLEELGIWSSEWHPVEIPRTGADGEPIYTAGFKSLPRAASRIDHYIQQVEAGDPEYHFGGEGENGIEAAFPEESVAEAGEQEAVSPAD